jgi:alpha-tubulin suppressor-like RCC1 family protein
VSIFARYRGVLNAFATLITGPMYTFGDNGHGRTGLNTNVGETLVPTQVGSFTDWSSISAHEIHSLALRKN